MSNAIKPKVYIIIVNYNGYDDTIACIESIQKITYSNYEIIVVDNGSTKKNLELSEQNFQKCKVIFLEDNFGFSAGNNIGIKYALSNNADYVILLNNDTVVTEDFLSKAISRFQKNEMEKIGILIGKINYYDAPEKAWYAGGEITNLLCRVLHYDSDKDSCSSQELYVNYATGCYYCIPAQVIKQVGFLPEEYFLYCEDTDYSTAMVKAGYKILYYPQSIIYHKVNGSTGNNSDLYKYYTTRNKFHYIRKYKTGIPYVLSMIYQLTRTYRNYFFRAHSKAYLWAIADYFTGKMGKTDRFFTTR